MRCVRFVDETTSSMLRSGRKFSWPKIFTFTVAGCQSRGMNSECTKWQPTLGMSLIIPESRFVGDFFFHRMKLNNEKPKTLESLLRKYGMSTVLAHCVPADPSTLASQMQDILRVRRHDLTRLWYQISNLSANYYDLSNSDVKTIAINYVRQVHNYGNAGDFCHGPILSIAEDDRPIPPDNRTRESVY